MNLQVITASLIVIALTLLKRSIRKRHLCTSPKGKAKQNRKMHQANKNKLDNKIFAINNAKIKLIQLMSSASTGKIAILMIKID